MKQECDVINGLKEIDIYYIDLHKKRKILGLCVKVTIKPSHKSVLKIVGGNQNSDFSRWTTIKEMEMADELVDFKTDENVVRYRYVGLKLSGGFEEVSICDLVVLGDPAEFKGLRFFLGILTMYLIYSTVKKF